MISIAIVALKGECIAVAVDRSSAGGVTAMLFGRPQRRPVASMLAFWNACSNMAARSACTRAPQACNIAVSVVVRLILVKEHRQVNGKPFTKT